MYRTLQYFYEKGCSIEAVITDRAYKEYDVKTDDFRELAERNGSAFYTTSDLSDPVISEFLKNKKSDIAISVNWKYVIPSDILYAFSKGILNLHLGNLPDYKGNATPNWAILNGEPYICLNVHKMTEDLDSGDIVAREKIDLSDSVYVGDVLKRSEALAPSLFYSAVERVKEKPDYVLAENSKYGSRCYPRSEEDHQINWNNSVENISRLIRASSKPYSGAYSYLKGAKIRFWKVDAVDEYFEYNAVPGQLLKYRTDAIFVACGDGVLKVTDYSADEEGEVDNEQFRRVRSRFRYRYE